MGQGLSSVLMFVDFDLLLFGLNLRQRHLVAV